MMELLSTSALNVHIFGLSLLTSHLIIRQSDDSTFDIVQLNSNGIRNKLTELGIFLERDRVKIVVVQESKLSSKSKTLHIQNYSTVRRDNEKPKTEDYCVQSQLYILRQTATVTKIYC